MIGMCDSGSGGLTVLSALLKRKPLCDTVYFGDGKNAPYGALSAAQLHALAERATSTLTVRGADELVFACNSLSAAARAGATGNVRYIEMSLPGIAALATKPQSWRGLYIATPATVAARLLDPVQVVSLDFLPVPGLAEAIEFGTYDTAETIVGEAFASRRGKQYDGLVLGCTHYPLMWTRIEALARESFGNIEVLDPAEAVADEVVKQFVTDGQGRLQFFLSKDLPHFRSRVEELFPRNQYSIEYI